MKKILFKVFIIFILTFNINIVYADMRNITYIENDTVLEDVYPKNYEEGKITSLLKGPSKTGYTFDGWYIDSNLTNRIVNISKTMSGDITLFAKYVEGEIKDNKSTIFKSCEYLVEDRELGRVIIGVNPNTTIMEFLSNLENNSSYIKVYDKDGIETTSNLSLVTTGMIVKLEFNDTVYDEAIVIVRGDVNEDGTIDVSDKVVVQDHLLLLSEINDYRLYAMDLDNERVINISDNVKLGDYLLHKEGIVLNDDDVYCLDRINEPAGIVSLNSASGYYKNEPYKSKVKTATYVNYIDLDNAVMSWDLSAKKDGSVMVWLNENEDYYDLYFGSEYTITPTGQTPAAMFHSLTNLETVRFNGLLDTSQASSIKSMFMKCNNLKYVDFETLDTSSAVDMQEVFQEAKSIEHIDLRNIDTSKATNMNRMFTNTNKLQEIDLSRFDTSNVKTMASMFSSCSVITSLDVSHFDTTNVTDMTGLFQNTQNLKYVDVSNFKTDNVTNMKGMFGYMKNLESLDLSNFNTSKVTDMSNMFAGTTLLTEIDVSSFDTSSVTNMSSMFYNNPNLRTIYVSDKWNISNVTSSSNMFYNDRLLVGDGAAFDKNMVTADYATTDYYMTLKQ